MAEGASSLLRIPGNIKQAAMPFVLDYSAKINRRVTESADLKGAAPQFFSFRPNAGKGNSGGGFGVINICPSSFKDYMNDDISHKLLYKMSSNKLDSSSIDANAILNNIPGIQIREFLPDTRLDQALNFFGDIMKKMKSVWTDDKDKQKEKSDNLQQQAANKDTENKDTTNLFDKLSKAAKWTLSYLTASNESENMFDVIQSYLNEPTSGTPYDSMDQKLKNYIVNFPFILYYRFQSCVTTNVYELPFMRQGNMLYQSDGTAGWEGASKLELVNDLIKNVPVLGKVVDTILGNVRVHFMPWWDSAAGSGTAEPEIQITFELFNDTDEAAKINFIFVNTLIANNRWIQYNVFEHSPSLYDIKIEGCNRLFACTGKFDVAYKGVLRDPTENWIKSFCTKHASDNISWNQMAQFCIDNKLIKIPDIYTVTLTFSSILPANFNQFIFQYACNGSIHKKKGYEPSIVPDMMGAAMGDFTTKLKSHWDSNSWPGVK